VKSQAETQTPKPVAAAKAVDRKAALAPGAKTKVKESIPEKKAEQLRKQELEEAARILKTKGSKKPERRKAAAILGLVGGSIGGTNRARNLTPEQRTEIARKGGLARQAKAREARTAADDREKRPRYIGKALRS
jgi:hypothetical protein